MAPATEGSARGAVRRRPLSFVRTLVTALLAAFVLAAAGGGAPGARGDGKLVPSSQAQVQLSFAPLVKQAAPAVVNIYTRRVVEQTLRSPLFDDPFFQRFFGPNFPFGRELTRRRLQNSLGSGVIVSTDGMIVTNHHVIKGAQEITVALPDRREFAAELVITDERTDLAILRIDTGGEALPFLAFRDSRELEVGDLVLAIGNPFNVGQTVTSGIVSALARTSVGASDVQFFIQTDAAINPGNSGGALIGMDGRLIGINTAIFSRSGGSHGIGFAIPANMVRVVVDSAERGVDYVQRPWLGAAAQTLSADIATSMGLDRPSGVLVRALHPDGPAAKAGVQVGDIIVAVDGQEVGDPRGLNFQLGTRMLGGETTLSVLREGRARDLRLALVRAPEIPKADLSKLRGRNPLAGATIANLSPALAEKLGLDTMSRGVIVLRLDRRSAAANIGLKRGDRLLRINRKNLTSVAQTKAILDAGAEEWRLTIRRGDRNFTRTYRS